jgi:16S rRNA (guanine966-N2)-methyltransferase
MSIVHGLLPGARVLDLCAGSGALGIEALSRGADHATFVESSERVIRTLRDNIRVLGADERSTIIRADAVRFVDNIDTREYDIAFADPPYATGVATELASRWLVMPFAATVGIEHSSRTDMPAGGDTRRYGDTAITFYRI